MKIYANVIDDVDEECLVRLFSLHDIEANAKLINILMNSHKWFSVVIDTITKTIRLNQNIVDRTYLQMKDIYLLYTTKWFDNIRIHIEHNELFQTL